MRLGPYSIHQSVLGFSPKTELGLLVHMLLTIWFRCSCFVFIRTDSTLFTTRSYNNLLLEKSTRILWWTPPSWFCAVSQLETGSQGLIRTGLSLATGIRKLKNPKAVVVFNLGLKMEYALNMCFERGSREHAGNYKAISLSPRLKGLALVPAGILAHMSSF